MDQTMSGDVIKFTFDHPMEVPMTLTVTDVAGNEASATITATIISSNSPPTMTLGMVDPPEGHTETEYTFKVTLWDVDGHLGTVRINIDLKTYDMVPDPSDADTSDGVVYTYTTKLGKGEHEYYFLGEDPLGLEATGPCVGDENIRTMTVYPKEAAAVPGMGAILAMMAIGLLGLATAIRRRKEVVE
ncbi:MAG: hypothetical protein GWN18_02325 [Thermoplasmata archaeon]|nr:hypothetical protein [Thermoplasmata archaeon]NIS10848.1 hypothetical protein [Thermoplasmata archaeon]NIW81423.1 hypothetical protein [Thermoplasmata archaeon]NIW87631.1 hypothetical protein [Thermoplasmata archaeon]